MVPQQIVRLVSPGGPVGGIIWVVTLREVEVTGEPEVVCRHYAEALTRFATGLVGPADAAVSSRKR